jgi:hypothetical protein
VGGLSRKINSDVAHAQKHNKRPRFFFMAIIVSPLLRNRLLVNQRRKKY